MSKIIMLVISVCMLQLILNGQDNCQISGIVVDENNEPVKGAYVFLYPVKIGSITDDKGNFSIINLSKGSYTAEITMIGYVTLVDTISINGNKSYHVQLKSKSFSLQNIVITDSYFETRKKEESLNIEIIDKKYIKQNLGGSLMNSLERLPGITTIDIGSGQSKPVIRGLGFNRVVVVENSIKHEAQEWGSDHGLEIDLFAIENIEVIKGPASLIYGSDAMGGVIDIENKKLPEENSFGGLIDLTAKTNNDLLGSSVSLFGRKTRLFADLRATILDYGDYKVPANSVDIYSYRASLYKNNLRNTAGKELNLHFNFGLILKNFQSRFYLSNVNSKNGFFANAHGLEPRNVDTFVHDKSNRDINYPYQQVNHFKIINSSQYSWSKVKLESNLGFQRNYRQEWSQYVSHGYMPSVFPDSLSFAHDLERHFDKEVFSGNIKFSFHVSEKTLLKAGINSEYQINKIDGRAFIIPAYNQLNSGAYAHARHMLSEKSIIQWGIRYDFGKIRTSVYHDWFLSPIVENIDTIMQYLQRAGNINRSFSNFIWSVGYNYNHGKWAHKVNAGKSFRMPIAKELAANGVNYHHFSYEVGNPELSPEISYQLDIGTEYNSKKLIIGTTPFLNYFSNYIYLNPTSEYDRLYGNGNQVFYYTQSKVLRYGGEIHSSFKFLKYLQLGIVGEYVFSKQLSGDKKGYTLPFSPPASAMLNAKYQKAKIKSVENVYFSCDFRMTAEQTYIVPPEEITKGYQVIDIGLGGDIFIKKQKVSIALQVQNLLNTKYLNHTSYYRLINVPEHGRNFVMNISIPFSGKIK